MHLCVNVCVCDVCVCVCVCVCVVCVSSFFSQHYLPGVVGEHIEGEGQQNKAILFTHKRIDIGYSGDQVSG